MIFFSKKTKPKRPEHSYSLYLGPKYWSTWFGIFVLYLISWLPYPVKQWFGAQMGVLLYKLGGSRRTIAETNIKLCFPELSEKEQDELVIESFKANMKGMVETTIAWWCNKDKILSNMKVYGMEHYEEAKARGKGVFIIGGHFSIIDMAGPLAEHAFGFNYMYRPNDNPLFNAVIERHRRQYSTHDFTKNELPQMMEFLKGGGTVWYGYDQDFGAKRSVFAPFFNIQTATLKAPARIARDTGATCIMISQFRESSGIYSLHFSPILEDYPSGDDVADATRINAQLEEFVRIHPEQYLWMHRRFRSRPPGEESLYPKKKRKKK